MLSVVGNLCVTCVLVVGYYTGLLKTIYGLCIKSLFIPSHREVTPLVFPHTKVTFNSLVQRLSHISHRTYKYNDYLYNLIIIKHMEKL